MEVKKIILEARQLQHRGGKEKAKTDRVADKFVGLGGHGRLKGASPVAQLVKSLPAMPETLV